VVGLNPLRVPVRQVRGWPPQRVPFALKLLASRISAPLIATPVRRARIPWPARPSREARLDGSSTPLATALAARGAVGPSGVLGLARATRAVTPKPAVLRLAATWRSSRTHELRMGRHGRPCSPIALNNEQTRRTGHQRRSARQQKSTSLILERIRKAPLRAIGIRPVSPESSALRKRGATSA
jgi:hypothetical protein